MNSKIFLIGVGKMGTEYAKVLKGLGKDFIAIGRSTESAKKFKEATGVEALEGGLASYLSENNVEGARAIVAVDIDTASENTELLIQAKAHSILLEKPGGVNQKEIKELKELADRSNTKIFIGYNRHFYASVAKAREIIKEDGGVLSFIFEFNERVDVVEKLEVSEEVKNNWFLANSSHVADLAFHLGGKPKELKNYRSGALAWHPAGAGFAGSG